jgi:predicted nucleic acid-binding protein
MSPAQFLIDTSALGRILRDEAIRARWEQQITAGTIAVCPIVELEVLYTARSKADRDELVELLRTAFAWVVMPDRTFDRAAQVQAALTDVGAHRSAGAVDLLIAATADLHGLTLLHYDHDFDQVVRVTGQRAQWLAPPGDVA